VLPGDPAADSVACIPMEERWAGRRLLVCRPEGADALRAEWVERIRRLWRA
jgi:hypothetical protein